MTRTIVLDEPVLQAEASWLAGTPPDGGEFSPASLSGLILASGLKQGAFAARCGHSVNTLFRWRHGALRKNGEPFRPTAAEWEGLKTLAPKVAPC